MSHVRQPGSAQPSGGPVPSAVSRVPQCLLLAAAARAGGRAPAEEMEGLSLAE